MLKIKSIYLLILFSIIHLHSRAQNGLYIESIHELIFKLKNEVSLLNENDTINVKVPKSNLVETLPLNIEGIIIKYYFEEENALPTKHEIHLGIIEYEDTQFELGLGADIVRFEGGDKSFVMIDWGYFYCKWIIDCDNKSTKLTESKIIPNF